MIIYPAVTIFAILYLGTGVLIFTSTRRDYRADYDQHGEHEDDVQSDPIPWFGLRFLATVIFMPAIMMVAIMIKNVPAHIPSNIRFEEGEWKENCK